MTKFYLPRLDTYKENFVLFISIFLNFWIWKIFKLDKLIAVLLIFLTFFFFQLLIKKGLNFLKLFLVVAIFLGVSFLMLRYNFDKNLFLQTPEDQIQINNRHFYYAKELGSLFLNSKVLNYYKNYSTIVSKFESNLFSNLDLNLYFFASHPRERAGIDEFEKFPYLLLPVFIFGVIQVIRRNLILSVGYIIVSLFLSAFISLNYKLGPILLFPLFTISITFGLINFLSYIKVKKNET